MIDSILVPIIIIPVPPLPSSTFNSISQKLKLFNVMSKSNVVRLNMDPGLLSSELTVHSNILGVIGIVHCSNSNDLSHGKEKFSQMLDNYPKCLASIIVAYDSNDSLESLDDSERVVVIPSNLESQYSKHLSDLVENIIGNLEKMVLEKLLNDRCWI